ncbi:MAG: hypothetical protein ACT4ON_03740 [Bacteroidota bacterium]
MKPSEDLFDLIKSLSPNEKRYFTINASRHVIGEKNNYIRLFEMIDKQKAYNEEVIKNYFKGEVFIKQMTFTKNYLYNLILKSLNSYHTELSIDSQIKELLRNVEILYSKTLYKQCSKVLARAKELAYSYEKHVQILEILVWENNIADVVYRDNDTLKKINENYYQEFETILNTLKSIRKYQKLVDEIYLTLLEEGQFRNKTKMKKLDEVFQKAQLNEKEADLSFDAKRFLYSARSLYYEQSLDPANYHLYTTKLAKLFESSPKQIQKHTGNYVNALNNLVMSCKVLKKYDEAVDYIKKMRKIALAISKNSEINKRIFERSYCLELDVNIGRGHFEKNTALIKEIEAGFNLYKVGDLYKGLLQFDIAYSYFGMGAFNKALMWLNKVLNTTALEFRPDIFCNAQLFNLIIHFELGNKDLLEYIVKSTYRFLYKKESLYKFEVIMLQYIKKSALADTPKKMIELFKSLKQELLPLLKDPYEKRILLSFDYISWLESKIEKRSFADCVKRRATFESEV